MHLDAQIALNVMEHFTANGEACLCIHDSFIVVENLEKELYKVMDVSYRKITKKFSSNHGDFSCKITRN
jgi:hypothetical protein